MRKIPEGVTIILFWGFVIGGIVLYNYNENSKKDERDAKEVDRIKALEIKYSIILNDILVVNTEFDTIESEWTYVMEESIRKNNKIAIRDFSIKDISIIDSNYLVKLTRQNNDLFKIRCNKSELEIIIKELKHSKGIGSYSLNNARIVVAISSIEKVTKYDT